MRIDRLEIGGFGRLGDLELDFDPRLTVVLGENESGKSTVHRALRAALYGLDAGGPGRPTDRSDWARWAPWSGQAYSVVLTYRLGDGRRLRVARRLERREQACQVHEIGGGDVTVEARVGRVVAPGLVHLGIDEAVFCASACVGEEGLRLEAGDAPSARAGEVQEAIERLADSGERTTAAQALAAIQDAISRVGSERRSGSPLGRAVNRLRQLDVQVDEARRRLQTAAAEEERLRSLESAVECAEARRDSAERGWLLGRLAAIASQREDLAGAAAELTEVAAEVAATAHLAGFPIDAEERATALAAEARETRRAADEARARAAAAAPQLAHVRRRRAEIGAGLRALAHAPTVDDEAAAEAAGLDGRLSATTAGRRREQELAASLGRRDALRREMAATGIAGTSAADVEAAIELVGVAGGSRSHRTASLAATLTLLGGAVVAAVAAASHHVAVALLAGILALVGAVAILGVHRLAGEAEQAGRRIAALCPGVTPDGEGLARLAQRLPRLRALNAELEREEARLETLAGEVEVTAAKLGALAGEAATLALQHGLGPAQPHAPHAGAEETIRAVVTAFAGAAGIGRRRRELEDEDAVLADRERDLAALEVEAADRDAAADAVLLHMRRVLAVAGLETSLAPADAVAACRAGCAGRGRHHAALRRLAELRRHRSLAADGPALDRLEKELERRLRARGGDPAEAASAEPLDHTRLQDLETEVEHARQGAVAASTAATALRARLAEMHGDATSLADLEDERAACAAARDRGQRQLSALQRAAELISHATASIHRDLAPRLAESVAQRLVLLTDGRYSAVNVDTSHFQVSLLGGDRPDLVPLDLVSHGTRDQVSLLLRLALAEVLSEAGEAVPLLLDEPLLSADVPRRAAALRFLWNLSATNQVVLSTSDPTLVSELQQVSGAPATVLTLPSATPTLEPTGRAVRGVRLL